MTFGGSEQFDELDPQALPAASMMLVDQTYIYASAQFSQAEVDPLTWSPRPFKPGSTIDRSRALLHRLRVHEAHATDKDASNSKR
jgi:hypothetical protein